MRKGDVEMYAVIGVFCVVLLIMDGEDPLVAVGVTAVAFAFVIAGRWLIGK